MKLTLVEVVERTAASCDGSLESFAGLERRRTADEVDRCDWEDSGPRGVARQPIRDVLLSSPSWMRTKRRSDGCTSTVRSWRPSPRRTPQNSRSWWTRSLSSCRFRGRAWSLEFGGWRRRPRMCRREASRPPPGPGCRWKCWRPRRDSSDGPKPCWLESAFRKV